MFERYTERARRVLFFGRYESSQLGSTSIEPEHILFGLLREKSYVTRHILTPAGVTLDGVIAELQRNVTSGQKTSTSVEIPFSPACKHVLQYAAEEANGLQHAHIGTEHLLLGVLREGQSPAAQLLGRHGIDLTDIRQKVGAAPLEKTTLRRTAEAPDDTDTVDADELRRRIKAIREALDDLEKFLLS